MVSHPRALHNNTVKTSVKWQWLASSAEGFATHLARTYFCFFSASLVTMHPANYLRLISVSEKVLFHSDTLNKNRAVMYFSLFPSFFLSNPPPTKTNQQDFFFQFIPEPFKSVLRQEIFYFGSLASFFLLLLSLLSFSNWDISNFETRKFFSITFQS